MEVDFELTEDGNREARQGVLHPLAQFNVAQAGPIDFRPLAILLRDRSTKDIAGGLWGQTAWKWLFVELLFVPEPLRGSGIGASLIRQAEEEAIRRGCVGAWLDTFSYQAPDFYPRLGYTCFGKIENYPPGHDRVFFMKKLIPAD